MKRSATEAGLLTGGCMNNFCHLPLELITIIYRMIIKAWMECRGTMYTPKGVARLCYLHFALFTPKIKGADLEKAREYAFAEAVSFLPTGMTLFSPKHSKCPGVRKVVDNALVAVGGRVKTLHLATGVSSHILRFPFADDVWMWDYEVKNYPVPKEVKRVRWVYFDPGSYEHPRLATWTLVREKIFRPGYSHPLMRVYIEYFNTKDAIVTFSPDDCNITYIYGNRQLVVWFEEPSAFIMWYSLVYGVELPLAQPPTPRDLQYAAWMDRTMPDLVLIAENRSDPQSAGSWFLGED